MSVKVSHGRESACFLENKVLFFLHCCDRPNERYPFEPVVQWCGLCNDDFFLFHHFFSDLFACD